METNDIETALSMNLYVVDQLFHTITTIIYERFSRLFHNFQLYFQIKVLRENFIMERIVYTASSNDENEFMNSLNLSSSRIVNEIVEIIKNIYVDMPICLISVT